MPDRKAKWVYGKECNNQYLNKGTCLTSPGYLAASGLSTASRCSYFNCPETAGERADRELEVLRTAPIMEFRGGRAYIKGTSTPYPMQFNK